MQLGEVTLHNEIKRGKSPLWEDIALLPERLKSTFFEIFSSGSPRRRPGVKKKFQNTLILVFEVIRATT